MQPSFAFLCRGIGAILIYLFLSPSLSAQYITTFAGNGVNGCNINDEPAICTPFNNPTGVCVAPNGDVYITCGNAVRKITLTTGIVSRIAGSDNPGSTGDGGPAINALVQFPKSVRMDKSGNLYIAELSGHRVRKITMSTGIISTIAGIGTAGYGGDGGPAVNASLSQPSDLSIDDDGNVFIADFLNSRIRKIDAVTGIITTIAGNGNAAYSGDNGLAKNAEIPHPNSICNDTAGNLYISETFGGVSCRIRKIDAITGIITTIAGNNTCAFSGDGGLAKNASLLSPSGVITDTSGNIYISEYGDSRIRKIDGATGIINTIAGTGSNGYRGDGGLAINASLNFPVGLAVDDKGYLYVCDSYNLRVRKISLNASVPPPVNLPTIVIAASTTQICNNNPINFTSIATSTGKNPIYEWKKNGAAVGTNAPQYSDNGLKDGDIITCTLRFDECDIGTSKVISNSITMTGGIAGPPSVSIIASAATVCKNEKVVFTATAVNAGGNPVYQWKLNGINTGTNNPVYNSDALANGDVINCVLTTAPDLCSAGGRVVSGSIVMNVNTPPEPSVHITVSDNNICPGKEVDFTVDIQNGGPSPVYQWKLNGSNVGDNTNRYVSSKPANNDDVYCIVTSGIQCTVPASSNIIKLTVKSLPAIKIYPVDTVVIKGTQVQLQAIADGPLASYTWTPVAGINNPAVLNPVTIPLMVKTVYTFKITTPGNCVDSLNAVIKVQQKIFMPSAFSPNNDGVNDVFRINPDATVRISEFTIFNRWGQKMFSTKNIHTGWNGICQNTPQLPGSYVYIIKGTDENGPVFLKGSFVLIR